MEQLEGRVAVITGAGSGIGEGLARACAAEGMQVVVADIELEQAQRVASAIDPTGTNSLPVRVDVAERDAVEALAALAYETFGAVHLLCNNAGVLVYAATFEASAEDWEWVLSVNLRGVVHGVQAFVPRMRAQADEAHIVNTGSISGLVVSPDPAVMHAGPYITSKYAVVGLSETLREELKPFAIGVSVLCPGGVSTRIRDAARNRPAELGGPEAAPQPPANAGSAGGTRLPRRDPLDVAQLVLRGVRENRLYILTEPGLRPLVEERFQRLLTDFDALEE